MVFVVVTLLVALGIAAAQGCQGPARGLGGTDPGTGSGIGIGIGIGIEQQNRASQAQEPTQVQEPTQAS